MDKQDADRIITEYMPKHAVMKPDFEVSFDTAIYNTCGDMTRDSHKYPIRSWQFNTYYDDRNIDWRDNDQADYEYLYEYMSGRIAKESSQIDKFKRLYDKGYLASSGGIDVVNMVVVRNRESFNQGFPALPDELKVIEIEADKEIYALNKDSFPRHMQGLLRAWTKQSFYQSSVRARVLEQLVKAGVLKLPSETQKHGLNTILFSDILPR